MTLLVMMMVISITDINDSRLQVRDMMQFFFNAMLYGHYIINGNSIINMQSNNRMTTYKPTIIGTDEVQLF